MPTVAKKKKKRRSTAPIDFTTQLPHGELQDYPVDEGIIWEATKWGKVGRRKKKIKNPDRFTVVCAKEKCKNERTFGNRNRYNAWVTKHHSKCHKDEDKEFITCSVFSVKHGEDTRVDDDGNQTRVPWDEYDTEYRLVDEDDVTQALKPRSESIEAQSLPAIAEIEEETDEINDVLHVDNDEIDDAVGWIKGQRKEVVINSGGCQMDWFLCT
eukprot:201318_1